MAFDQNKYINDFHRQNYDVIRALIPKGKKEDIKKLSKTKGVSVSQLIVEALEKQHKIDLSK